MSSRLQKLPQVVEQRHLQIAQEVQSASNDIGERLSAYITQERDILLPFVKICAEQIAEADGFIGELQNIQTEGKNASTKVQDRLFRIKARANEARKSHEEAKKNLLKAIDETRDELEAAVKGVLQLDVQEVSGHTEYYTEENYEEIVVNQLKSSSYYEIQRQLLMEDANKAIVLQYLNNDHRGDNTTGVQLDSLIDLLAASLNENIDEWFSNETLKNRLKETGYAALLANIEDMLRIEGADTEFIDNADSHHVIAAKKAKSAFMDRTLKAAAMLEINKDPMNLAKYIKGEDVYLHVVTSNETFSCYGIENAIQELKNLKDKNEYMFVTRIGVVSNQQFHNVLQTLQPGEQVKITLAEKEIVFTGTVNGYKYEGELPEGFMNEPLKYFSYFETSFSTQKTPEE